MVSYKIHLIRTGSTSLSPWKRYVGQTDLPLCDAGREALHAMRGEFLYPQVQKVYTSPLSRCRQTAAILYPDFSAEARDGFVDMNLGSFEGRTFEELKDDDTFTAWLGNSFENTPPGGEQTAAFTVRLVDATDKLLRAMMQDKITSAAVITHGGVIMTLLAAIGLPQVPLHQWAVGNGAGYTILTNAQMWMQGQIAEVHAYVPTGPEEG